MKKSYELYAFHLLPRCYFLLETILMIMSKQAFILFFVCSFFVIGCKTSKPVSSKIPEKKGKAIKPYKSIMVQEKGNTSDSKSIHEYYGVHLLGDRKISLKFLEKGKGLTFVNLHDNENTSVKAIRQVLDSVDGRLIELQHSGERNIQFKLDTISYEFDPNRMFTDLGIKASLKQYGSSSGRAHKSVRALARRLVDSLDQRIIVTLHNNSNENYSSLSYLDKYKKEASEVYINPSRDSDDFFFVTTGELYEKLKNLGHNTVLQNNDAMTDDGSLSVLAGQRGIPYINVEAQHGHLDEQVEMLLVLIKVLE